MAESSKAKACLKEISFSTQYKRSNYHCVNPLFDKLCKRTTSRSAKGIVSRYNRQQRMSRVIAGLFRASGADGRKVRTPVVANSQEPATAGKRAW